MLIIINVCPVPLTYVKCEVLLTFHTMELFGELAVKYYFHCNLHYLFLQQHYNKKSESEALHQRPMKCRSKLSLPYPLQTWKLLFLSLYDFISKHLLIVSFLFSCSSFCSCKSSDGLKYTTHGQFCQLVRLTVSQILFSVSQLHSTPFKKQIKKFQTHKKAKLLSR